MKLFAVASIVLCAFCLTGLFLFRQHTSIAPISNRDIPPIYISSDHLKLTVFGTSLSDGYSWPDELGHRLEACMRYPVQVSRVVHKGGGSAWGLSAIEEVKKTAPDILILEFAINDSDILDGVSLEKSFYQHDRLIVDLQKQLPRSQILLMTTNPAFGLRGILRPRLISYYENYKVLAQKHNTGLADVYGYWAESTSSREHFPDGLHPLDDIATKIIAPVLLEIISRALHKICE